MVLLLKFWRECLILLLSLTLGVGVYLWPKPVAPTVITKDRVVTVTHVVRPDGTVEDHTVTTDTEKPVVTTVTKSRYLLGLSADPRNVADPLVQVGARLGDLPLFLNLGGKPVSREINLGVSYEF